MNDRPGAPADTDTDLIRRTFVARFGADEARRIENAAQSHYAQDEVMLTIAIPDILGEEALPTPHGNDHFGSSPFRYWFLLAIGKQCVTKYRKFHGITTPEDELRAWALAEGELSEHDGDIPDFIGLFVGSYADWIPNPEDN